MNSEHAQRQMLTSNFAHGWTTGTEHLLCEAIVVEKNNALCASVRIDSSLWEFALQVYSQAEIEQQSLTLQDQFGANINILLWCCWLEIEGVPLPATRLEDVLATVESLSLKTVAKLREVRRCLASSGFTKVQALTIKKHILNAELMIEKVITQRLQDLTCRFLESKDYAPASKGDQQLNPHYYLEFIGATDARTTALHLVDLCRRHSMYELG